MQHTPLFVVFILFWLKWETRFQLREYLRDKMQVKSFPNGSVHSRSSENCSGFVLFLENRRQLLDVQSCFSVMLRKIAGVILGRLPKKDTIMKSSQISQVRKLLLAYFCQFHKSLYSSGRYLSLYISKNSNPCFPNKISQIKFAMLWSLYENST